MSKRNRRKKKKELVNFKIVRDVDVLVAGQSFESCRVADAIEPSVSHQKFEDGDPYGFEGDCFPFARHREHFSLTRYV